MCKIKRGDIYYAILESNKNELDHRQLGNRPVLIISNNVCNEVSPVLEVVPITTRTKHPLPTHTYIQLKYESLVLCEQIMTINRSQLQRFIRKTSQEEMQRINECLKISIGL